MPYMTLELYDRLWNRGLDVPAYFVAARGLWDEIWKKLGDTPSEAGLANALRSAQIQFELNCGGRDLGQEIMAITAISQFYSPEAGFDGTLRRARLTRDAFRSSGCSGEVIGMVDRIAREYLIDERQP